MNWFCRARLSTLAALLLVCAPAAANAADVTVFAAASLTNALQEVGRYYEARSGHTVAFFAASSVLARQIEASGGADMFLSADSDWMNYLDTRNLIDHRTRRDLLGNHLVLIAPAGEHVSLAIVPNFNLAGALRGGRLAIADPGSVPAGKYAQTALTSLGVWNTVAGQLAPAENVRVALAYVARGQSPLGIVYTTDALSEPSVRIVGTFPDATHAPIVYPAALTRGANPVAAQFLDFLSGPEARDVFLKDGFIVPRRH